MSEGKAYIKIECRECKESIERNSEVFKIPNNDMEFADKHRGHWLYVSGVFNENPDKDEELGLLMALDINEMI